MLFAKQDQYIRPDSIKLTLVVQG